MISAYGRVRSTSTLQHVPVTAIHGGNAPPPGLINPDNPYWEFSATKTDGVAKGLVVYIDAVTGQVLFTTEYALK